MYQESTNTVLNGTYKAFASNVRKFQLLDEKITLASSHLFIFSSSRPLVLSSSRLLVLLFFLFLKWPNSKISRVPLAFPTKAKKSKRLRSHSLSEYPLTSQLSHSRKSSSKVVRGTRVTFSHTPPLRTF